MLGCSSAELTQICYFRKVTIKVKPTRFTELNGIDLV